MVATHQMRIFHPTGSGDPSSLRPRSRPMRWGGMAMLGRGRAEGFVGDQGGKGGGAPAQPVTAEARPRSAACCLTRARAEPRSAVICCTSHFALQQHIVESLH